MTHVAFYHLRHSTLGEALPKLLQFTLDSGNRALVRAGSADQLSALSSILWGQDNDSWLPHGMEKDRYAEDQPIWLTIGSDNPNDASFVFLIDGVEVGDVGHFDRCFDLFDGNNSASVGAARVRWNVYKDAGHELHYWQQTDQGKWEEKYG